ncbi:GyrI-like domain-containing protein [uncultured Muriicola sp.]|uniref:GyrI-like domain-containing protein n=1 Tax=uncultured Muriicola sp. TaxID=1583102 RepID=UPI002602AAEE|nr:GyrI-like domain-containing protein [uncultured Muriicola sp.]
MKKVSILILFLILGGIVWYVFVYPYDYLVTMQVKANTGTINQTIKLWNTSLENSELTFNEDLEHLSQTLYFSDSTHIYDWDISEVNDSISKIKIFTKDSAHSLINKIKIPFFDTDFEKRTKKTLIEFGELLAEDLKNIKIKVVGEGEIDSTYYAYVSNKTTQFEKAGGMMRDFPLLDPYLVNNGVELNGKPFIEITRWNMANDSLEFKFCYPIIKNDSLPKHPDLKYGIRTQQKALKAIYNGNYITSDRAWYALLDYAEKNNIEVTGLPIEIFYSNPNMGVNEITWKAEVYMPLSK